jgi:hypothetical protein
MRAAQQTCREIVDLKNGNLEEIGLNNLQPVTISSNRTFAALQKNGKVGSKRTSNSFSQSNLTMQDAKGLLCGQTCRCRDKLPLVLPPDGD